MAFNQIYQNQSLNSLHGGGVTLSGMSTIELTNNTITKNAALAGAGGGFASLIMTNTTGVNNIVYGNTSATPGADWSTDGLGTIDLKYSCASHALAGNGNITGNPDFMSVSTDDYRLNQGSPCIDTGDPASPLDPDNTRADMGALYYGIVSIESNHNAIPENFVMHSAYPNPFNPTTTIRYHLPVNSVVEIDIYDGIGRKIRTLINGTQKIGENTVVWNGRNDNGQPVSSGIYLCRFRASSQDGSAQHQQFQRIILLK